MSTSTLINPDPDFIEIAAHGKRVTIKPHGFQEIFPSQDTTNLQWFFEHYPHANLCLDSGLFHLSQTIEAVGYQGTIQGAGKTETFLVGRGPLVDSVEHIFPSLSESLKTRLNPSGVPHLFWFHPGTSTVDAWQYHKVDLKIRDLTIRLDGVGPIMTLNEKSVRSIGSLILLTGAQAIFKDPRLEVSHLRVNVRNVAFKGGITSYALEGVARGNSNTATGLMVYGGKNWIQGAGINGWKAIDQAPLNAQIEIRGCQFHALHQSGLSVETLFTHNTTTSYKFPRVPFPMAHLNVRQNEFRAIGGGAGISPGSNILSSGHSGALIQITNNQFEDIRATGITLHSSISEKLLKAISTVMIEANTFNHVASGISQASIRVLDSSFLRSGHHQLTITENKFTAPSGFNKSLIEIGMGAGVQIIENIFAGTALAGILIGAGLSAVGSHLAGNNFEALEGTHINLGPGAVNTTIAGIHDSATIVNRGVDTLML